MYLGELVEIGPAANVLQNPKHPYPKVLRWATADLDPDDEVAEPAVRDIDIPDPVDPPSGCRFHTRSLGLSHQGMDIDRSVYNDIMNLRHAVDERSTDLFGGDPTSSTVDRLRGRVFDESPLTPHRERVGEALAAVTDGEWDRAGEMLRERYESVCERVRPTATGEAHPVACHLYDDAQPGEPNGLSE